MTTALEEVDFDSALFEPLDPAPVEAPDDDPPPRRRRGRPLGSRNKEAAPEAAPRPPRGRLAAGKERELAAALADPMTKLGAAVAFALPTVGAVVVSRAETTSTALVRYAADKPRMLAALARVSKVGPGTDIIETVAMCVIAAQLDVGRMSPDHPLGKLTGVSAIHLEIMGHVQAVQAEQRMAAAPEAGVGFDIPPPPGWDPRMMNDPTNPIFSFSAQAGAQVRNN
jgi:hypothetical protein